MEFPRYSYQREGEGEEMPHQFGPPPPSTRLEVRRPTQKTKKLRPLKSSIYSLSRRRRRRVDGDNIPHHLRRSIETVSEPIDLIRVARDANFRTVWLVEVSKAQDADAFNLPPPPSFPLPKKKKENPVLNIFRLPFESYVT